MSNTQQAFASQLKVLPDGRMDAKNASHYLGLRPKTLAMMRCDGTGPRFTKIGGKVFYFKANLDAWIDDAGTFTSTSQARFKRGKD